MGRGTAPCPDPYSDGREAGAVLRKKYLRGWPLIIWEAINQSIKVICNARNVVHKLESEATKAKRNYYRTNYVKHVEKLGLNCPEKNFGGGLGKIWGGCAPLGPT